MDVDGCESEEQERYRQATHQRTGLHQVELLCADSTDCTKLPRPTSTSASKAIPRTIRMMTPKKDRTAQHDATMYSHGRDGYGRWWWGVGSVTPPFIGSPCCPFDGTIQHSLLLPNSPSPLGTTAAPGMVSRYCRRLYWRFCLQERESPMHLEF